MAKKYFLIVDTETTQTGLVADFGAVVCDKRGNVVASCAALVRETFLHPEDHPLFYTKDASPLWGKANLPKRYAGYNAMIENGSRMVASIPAINRWLAKANAAFNPVLTAYNLAFDQNAMTLTGIDHTIFAKRFCLWQAAAHKWGQSRAYRETVLETLAFNPPTKHGNMSYQTNAEVMARYVTANPSLPDEPHTAYEDALEYELPILVALVRNTPPKDYMNASPYNWRDFQVKDHFKVA
jgi:hypothetical protein